MPRKKTQDDTPYDPPEAPDTPRRISLERTQWVLLPLFLVLPVLALLRVFEGHTEHALEAGPLTASVSYPKALRYKVLDDIVVHVTNRSAGVIDSITIAIDTAYAHGFSGMVSTPSFDEPFRTSLHHVNAGVTRTVHIELEAERYWRHRGFMTITAGADTARVQLSTIVFP
jgi:hypothetical protein